MSGLRPRPKQKRGIARPCPESKPLPRGGKMAISAAVPDERAALNRWKGPMRRSGPTGEPAVRGPDQDVLPRHIGDGPDDREHAVESLDAQQALAAGHDQHPQKRADTVPL